MKRGWDESSSSQIYFLHHLSQSTPTLHKLPTNFLVFYLMVFHYLTVFYQSWKENCYIQKQLGRLRMIIRENMKRRQTTCCNLIRYKSVSKWSDSKWSDSKWSDSKRSDSKWSDSKWSDNKRSDSKWSDFEMSYLVEISTRAQIFSTAWRLDSCWRSRSLLTGT
jgi:hypothetical protein